VRFTLHLGMGHYRAVERGVNIISLLRSAAGNVVFPNCPEILKGAGIARKICISLIILTISDGNQLPNKNS